MTKKKSKTYRNAKKKFLPLWLQRAGKRNLTYPCGCFAPSALCALGSHSGSLRSLAFCASRSQKFFKKCVSQSTQNGLKRIEMQKKILYPFDSLRTLRVAQREAKRKLSYRCSRFTPSGLALRTRYLPHDTPRVPRSVHAKFHHDRIETMGVRGIQTYIHT